jgi:hypothetical protein
MGFGSWKAGEARGLRVGRVRFCTLNQIQRESEREREREREMRGFEVVGRRAVEAFRHTLLCVVRRFT